MTRGVSVATIALCRGRQKDHRRLIRPSHRAAVHGAMADVSAGGLEPGTCRPRYAADAPAEGRKPGRPLEVADSHRAGHRESNYVTPAS